MPFDARVGKLDVRVAEVESARTPFGGLNQWMGMTQNCWGPSSIGEFELEFPLELEVRRMAVLNSARSCALRSEVFYLRKCCKKCSHAAINQ